MSLRTIRLDPDGGDVLQTLGMTDISRSGMGAACDRSLYPGQRLLLCLPLTSAGRRRNIYATVIRCRPGREGYQVGLEFDNAATSARCGSASPAAAAA